MLPASIATWALSKFLSPLPHRSAELQARARPKFLSPLPHRSAELQARARPKFLSPLPHRSAELQARARPKFLSPLPHRSAELRARRLPDRHAATLAAVLGILGFLVVTAVATGQAERQKAEPRKAELVALIEDRQSQVDALDSAVETLRRDVTTAQELATRANSRDREEARIAASLGEQAGTVPLRGPGLLVSLAPSDREPPSPEEAGAYQIHDSDLQLVVNALWAAGADAIAVNDSRLVATTPIRAAGGTIVVNFRPLSPPYRVAAIGADRQEFETSDIARRFARWTNLFGLGFSVESRSSISVPGYTGRVSITRAVPDGIR